MRHQKRKYRIGTTPAHRRSLLCNLATEIIDHGKIKTTHTKCRALRPYVERLITLAKEDTVANRRLAYARLNNNRSAVTKLFNEIAPKFKDRAGGYTRTLKLPEGRVGDNAPMSYISLVD
ncbi:MAG: 50S ribosomal protein L17 [Bacteriovoracaceae bacterium]